YTSEDAADAAATGNPRPAHPQGPEPGAAAWTRGLSARRADHARGVQRSAGFALSGAASPRAARMARGLVGSIRAQPPRQVLPPNARRPAPVGRRNRRVETGG